MAGIGFRLDHLARKGGLAGIAGAGVYGAVISSGPWLMTAMAVLMLARWSDGMIAAQDQAQLQTCLVYAFSVSAVITAPISMIATRMASDSFYRGALQTVPSTLLCALVWTTGISLVVSYLLFGLAARMDALSFTLAIIIMSLFAQIWVATPFLHASRRYRPIFFSYGAGIVMAALLLVLLTPSTAPAALGAIAAGLVTTMILLIRHIREDFPSSAVWEWRWAGNSRAPLALGIAGLANAMAVWIDKWISWWSPTSVPALGVLRVNPIYDQASFLGLLTIIPGLTLILVTTETRFDRAFGSLMRHCTGTSSWRRIEAARQYVGKMIRLDLRLLVVEQAIVAAFCWVLASELLRLLNMDPRGIFAFRQTALGVVFHLVAIQMSIILSYYDLFGRVIVVWSVFLAVSGVGTLAFTDLGYGGFGFGYLAGAVASASVAVALVSHATNQLTYLLFVGNNPAVVGDGRLWS